MIIEKIKSIKISLMQSQSEIDTSTGKSEYIIKASAKFNISKDFFKEEDNDFLMKNLVIAIFEDLLEKSNNYIYDSVGIWIEYDDVLFDNSIKIQTLSDMKKYGVDDIDHPIYEFFKLTLKLTLDK